MSIRVKCGECGVALKIKDELAGQKGNCPKCKAALVIPARDASHETTPAAPAAEELSEEEAIFGKGFFEASAPPPRPRTLDLSNGDADPPPARKQPATPRKPETPPAAAAAAAVRQSNDNAADIAGSLLSKTGKKNRPEDLEEDDDDKVEYDFSELKYLLKTRILPSVAAVFVVAPLLYWLVNSAMGGGAELPPLAEVTGRVTVDGNPYPAQLVFFPADDSIPGSGSLAQCNPDGTYEVYYNADTRGAVIGPNTIRITAGAHRFVETREIVDGPNELNFDLKSKKN